MLDTSNQYPVTNITNHQTMKSLLFLSIVLLSACTSRFLVPLTYDFPTNRGTALVSELDSVRVMVENIELKGSYLVFDMEVNNRSWEPVEIVPEHICYYASPDAFKTLDSLEDVHALSMFYQNEFNYKERAMRPSEVEAYFLERLKTKQGVAIVLLLAGAGMVVHDAVQDAQDANKVEWTASDAKKAAARDGLTVASLVAIDIANEGLAASSYRDNKEMQYLPDELFPQKTIAPGDSFRGKVFFPKKEAHQHYRLIVPIGNTDYVFDFRKLTPEEKMKLQAQ